MVVCLGTARYLRAYMFIQATSARLFDLRFVCMGELQHVRCTQTRVEQCGANENSCIYNPHGNALKSMYR